jgi:hypothetical protein
MMMLSVDTVKPSSPKGVAQLQLAQVPASWRYLPVDVPLTNEPVIGTTAETYLPVLVDHPLSKGKKTFGSRRDSAVEKVIERLVAEKPSIWILISLRDCRKPPIDELE